MGSKQGNYNNNNNNNNNRIAYCIKKLRSSRIISFIVCVSEGKH